MKREIAASALVLILGSGLCVRSDAQGALASDNARGASQSAGKTSDLLGQLKAAANFKVAGHYDQAEKLLNQILQVSHNDAKNAEIDEAAKNMLAGVYLHTDRCPQALKTYTECLPIVGANHGATSAQYATVLDNMAQAYLGLNEFSEAEENQLKSIKIYEALEPQYTRDLGQAYSNIAMTYEREKKIDQTLEYQKKAQELYEKVLPANHPLMAINLDNIGITLQASGNLEEAEKYHRQALAMLEPALGAHPDVAIAMDNLADTLSKEKKYDESLQYFDKELQVWTKLYGAQSKRTLECAIRRETVVQTAKQK